MAHNKCAKGGRIGGRFLGAAVGGGGRTVLHMGLLDRTGSVCVGFPLDGDSGDGLSSNRGSCSSGGGGTAAALTVYKIIKN